MTDTIVFDRIHDYAALRRHVVLAGEHRAQVRAPDALNVLSELLGYAAFGSIIATFVWAFFGYTIFGTPAFTILFASIAIAFILAFGSIVLEQDADNAFDWRMPGATLREKACGYVGKLFSGALGAALTPAYLLALTMPADVTAGLAILFALSAISLSGARVRTDQF